MSSWQDTLLREFEQIQGAVGDSTEAWSVGGSGSDGGIGGGQRDTAPRGTVDALGDQTGNIEHGGSSSSSSSASGSSSILDDVGGALAGGLGIVPLGLEIASLFGGSSSPPQLDNYAMPDSIGFVGSTDGSTVSSADFNEIGQPWSYGAPSTPAAATVATPSSPSGGGSTSGQPVQITVQAMDSQSFMDRSDDIANAVNKALLSLHPLADTISNL